MEYDPKVMSYAQVIERFFDMQGGPPQYGSFSRQYRSAILVHNADQKAVVESIFNEYARQTGSSFVLFFCSKSVLLSIEVVSSCSDLCIGKKIYTDVEPATNFYRAEEYHQNYVDKSRR